MDRKVVIKGWLLALFSVWVLWGLNNVMIGYSAKVLHVNYLVYTCCGFISASFALMCIGGLKDNLARETFRSSDTLILSVVMFGFVMLVGYLLTLSLFFYTSSTEGAFLQRISMIFSIVIAWIFMQRRPTKIAILGCCVVFLGILLICSNIPEEHKGIVYLIMLLEGAALTGRTFVAETHKTYNKALKQKDDPKLKTRVVGFVMFMISIIFLIISLLLAWLQTYYPVFDNSSIVPSLSDFHDYKSIFAGLFAGVVLITPLRLIEFFSSNAIKSENVLALAAFSPFATLFWEWLLKPITGLGVKGISTDNLVAGSIVTIGCLIVAVSQIIKLKKHGVEAWREYIKEYDKDDFHVYNSKDIVKQAIEHCSQDIKQASESLGISQCTLYKIVHKDNYGFKGSAMSAIIANFKENIALTDKLTKIRNRSGFESIAEKFIEEKQDFCLMFIDLDEFKPINDNYGHDAGDKTLKTIANRLYGIENDDIKVARLAGDEFVVLFKNYSKEFIVEYVKKFVEVINEKIVLDSGEEVSVGASMGVSQFKTDGTTLKDLLKHADTEMYKHKSLRR
ncbi:MAG: diguanylate cyclase [Proteobacteria bacterium]|nr:diguanylate cyclase [Pseudomonadota bacterium]